MVNCICKGGWQIFQQVCLIHLLPPYLPDCSLIHLLYPWCLRISPSATKSVALRGSVQNLCRCDSKASFLCGPVESVRRKSCLRGSSRGRKSGVGWFSRKSQLWCPCGKSQSRCSIRKSGLKIMLTQLWLKSWCSSRKSRWCGWVKVSVVLSQWKVGLVWLSEDFGTKGGEETQTAHTHCQVRPAGHASHCLLWWWSWWTCWLWWPRCWSRWWSWWTGWLWWSWKRHWLLLRWKPQFKKLFLQHCTVSLAVCPNTDANTNANTNTNTNTKIQISLHNIACYKKLSAHVLPKSL